MPRLSRRALLLAGATTPLLPAAHPAAETPLAGVWREYLKAREAWSEARTTFGEDSDEAEACAVRVDGLVERLAKAPPTALTDLAIKLTLLLHLWGLDHPKAEPCGLEEWTVTSASGHTQALLFHSKPN